MIKPIAFRPESKAVGKATSKPQEESNRKGMDDKRKQWKMYCKEHRRIAAEWNKRGYRYPDPEFPPISDALRDLRCGARTKSTGEPCKRKDIYSNGRCKFHGGLSTGPKTAIGKQKSSQNSVKKSHSS